jgi:hypothetical protein
MFESWLFFGHDTSKQLLLFFFSKDPISVFIIRWFLRYLDFGVFFDPLFDKLFTIKYRHLRTLSLALLFLTSFFVLVIIFTVFVIDSLLLLLGFPLFSSLDLLFVLFFEL